MGRFLLYLLFAVFVCSGLFASKSWAQSAPAVTSISPSAGLPGSTITVTGTNFTGTKSVLFGGIPAKFTIQSATQLAVIVPATAATGPIRVTNASGTVLSSPFTVMRNSNSYTFTAITSFNYNPYIYNGNKVAENSTPIFTNLDGDNLIDMLVGTIDGNLEYYEQSAVNSLSFTRVSQYLIRNNSRNYFAPAVTDLDGDGLLDILVGDGQGFIDLYEQSAVNSTAFNIQSTNLLNLDIGRNAAPAVTDLDGDGLLDIIIGLQDGSLQHFEQNAANGLGFTQRTSFGTSFNNIDVGGTHGYAQPKLVDLDGDGLLDLVVGAYDGTTHYYEQSAPYSLTFTGNATLIPDVGDHASPGFTDLNGDGLLELVMGEWKKPLALYQQQTSPKADVGVTISASAGPYAVGKTITFTVTVTNSGPNPASSISVSDLLDPTKFQNITSSDAVAYNVANRVWNAGTLAVNASKTLTITAQPTVTGSISVTAKQSHAEVDHGLDNNSQVVTLNVVPAADIEVKNTVLQTDYNNGDLVTYTITAKNLGPNAATGVVVLDKLPSSLVLQGTAPSAYDAATGNWTVGTLAVNEIKTLTLQTKATALGTFTTTATLGDRTSHQLDENTNNNTSSNTITVHPAAEAGVTNVVSNTTPNQGESITYTIKATNNGPNTATNVVVTGTIPAGLTFTGSTASVGTVTIGASSVSWNVGSVISGATQSLVLTATPTATGQITYTVTQTHSEADANTGNNSAAQIINVNPTADIKVENVVNSPAPAGDAYSNGDVVTYRVTVTNNGPSTATNLKVTDLLPASLTDVTYTASQGSYTRSNGEWVIGSLANAGVVTLDITAKVAQSAIINTTASVGSVDQYDNVADNNSASNTIQAGTGVITADIGVSVSVPAQTYYTNNPVEFTVRVTNNGPDAGTNLKFDAPLPAGFTFVSATGSYANGVWTVPSLAAGAFVDLELTGKPNPDPAVTGDKTSTFTASRTGTFEQADNNTGNNSASAMVTVKKQSDVAVTKTVTSDSPDGKYYHNLTVATFTITVTNNGPDKVTGLQGRDTRTGTISPIPNGLSFSEGTSYSYTDGIWTVGDLNPGDSKTLVLKGKPNTTGRLNLGGRVTYQDQFDPVPENNAAISLLTVLPVAELEVTNTLEPGNYYNGENATFTVKVQNNGPDAATQVKIQDKLPAGLQFVGAVTSSGSYDPVTGIWALGTDLLTGAANAQTMALTVKALGTDTYTTIASVQQPASEYDNISTNNSASAHITPALAADIDISSTITAGPYYTGSTYTIVVDATNLGPDVATAVSITNQLSGLELMNSTAAPGTSFDAASGVWSIGSLKVGSSEKKSLTLVVKPLEAGHFSNTAYKTFSQEYDKNGGNTSNANNSTVTYGEASEPPVVLPVTLLKFTAKEQSNGVLLSWTTATEKNSNYVAVERSSDGRVFSKIAQVKAKGNSSQLADYHLLDTKAPTGWVYYRLNQVDFDGKSEHSSIVTVYQKETLAHLNLYPNPTADRTMLDLTSLPDENFTICIINIQGQRVKQINTKGGAVQTLDVSNLAAGKYIVQIRNEFFMQVINLLKN